MTRKDKFPASAAHMSKNLEELLTREINDMDVKVCMKEI